MSQSSQVPECRHILPRGVKCHALALNGKPFCYYHFRKGALTDANRTRKRSVALPPLEDHAAIQMSLDEILAAFGAGKITRREAGTYLYALQIGALNLSRIQALPPPEPIRLSQDQPDEVLAAEDSHSASPTDTAPSFPAPGQPHSATAADSAPHVLSEPSPAGDPISASAFPNPLIDDPGTHASHEYDPEPALPLTKKELHLKRRQIEESLRNYREARRFHAARAARNDTRDGDPSVVVAYLDRSIEKSERELEALNEDEAPETSDG